MAKKEECKYQEGCNNQGAVNDEQLCVSCAEIVGMIRERIASGQLPKVPNVDPKGPRMTALPRDRGGMPCAGCDMTIAGAHMAYPDFPDPAEKRHYDLHFHDLCHDIWEEEATT